jgi:Ca-activated chloride channel family protein
MNRRLIWIGLPHAVAILAGIVVISHVRTHYELDAPWSLWLALLAPLYVGMRFWRTMTGREVRASFNLHRYNKPARILTSSAEAIPEISAGFRTGALILLAVAGARPQSSSSIEDLTREGLDIVLSMDLSASMLSKDFSPNRLEAAKEVAAQFVEDRPDDRIGVVAYEGEAFTSIPLTTDQRVVMNGIASLETGLLEGGTAIGMGLATAVNRLKTSDAESKVIILLTDGVNNQGAIEPLDAAQLAKLNNIRVYTIGVGTIGKARSPVRKMGSDYIYDWVEVKIDEPVLKDIARMTGGRYFRATSEEKLESIYEEIDALEKTRFNVLRYNQKTEEFSPFALGAVLCLLVEFLLRHLLVRSIL